MDTLLIALHIVGGAANPSLRLTEHQMALANVDGSTDLQGNPTITGMDTLLIALHIVGGAANPDLRLF